MKLLFSILCPKPELRASMEEIQANDWINQPVDINNYKWEDVIRDTEFNGNNAGESNREELLQRINEQNLLKHQEEEDETVRPPGGGGPGRGGEGGLGKTRSTGKRTKWPFMP